MSRIYLHLSVARLSEIVEIQVRGMAGLLAERGIGITLTDAAKDFLAREGYDPAFGARPLKRLIQKEIQDVLALKLLTGEFVEGQTVEVDAHDLGLKFTAASAPEAVEDAEVREKA